MQYKDRTQFVQNFPFTEMIYSMLKKYMFLNRPQTNYNTFTLDGKNITGPNLALYHFHFTVHNNVIIHIIEITIT